MLKRDAEVTVLSLDLDETLWQMEGVIEQAERAMHAHLWTNHPAVATAYPPERMRQLSTNIAATNPSLKHNVTALRLRTLEHAVLETGAPRALADEAFAVFMEARHHVRLYPDAIPLLELLHKRLPLVALTNGNADVQRLGMGHYFAASCSAADVGAAKPDRSIFEAAADRAGISLHNLIHVGDDPLTDVAGAAQHGLRAVWLNRSGSPWPEHAPWVTHDEITSLDELPGVLTRLQPDLARLE
ncbi:HAD-IA family hydrolase [Salicola sp. Rm-C-2C1-2]|uniref:HAD family hydrolase n=1 Tax=Salicola sp. Rm-C-2C1-2 TaxID=3141321 RepID=UPI0032E4B7F6